MKVRRHPESRGPRLRSSWVAWVAIIAFHLVGFGALYIAVDRVFRDKIIETYLAGSGALIEEAIRDLRPAMDHGDRQGFVMILQAFADDHGLSEVDVTPLPLMGEGLDNAAEIGDFLRSGETSRLRLEAIDGRAVLRGLVRVDSADECRECHGDNDPIAVAAVARDASAQVLSLNADLRRTVLFLVIGWIGLVTASGAVLRRASHRSASLIRADLQAVEHGESVPAAGDRDLGLDPVTRDAHLALRDFLERERQRRSRDVGRMERAETLASLGQVAAGLAHEIKNPLAGLKGALEILRGDCDDAETRGVHTQMLEEVQRVDLTVQSLLDLARPAPPRVEATDVAQLADDVVLFLGPGFAKRRVALSTKPAVTPAVAWVDRTQIRQVLVNLLQNAAEAIGEAGEIIVQVTAVDGDGEVVITVTDNGPGISEAEQVRIFDPFHSTKPSGTGLGLAIARSLIRRHGGDILVESSVGQGSTFLVILKGRGEVNADD